MLRVSRYIHLNPVKACLVKHPGQYLWSSYRFYTNRSKPSDWLYTKEILSYFGTKQQKNKYSLFVLENTDKELESFYRKTKLLPILGSDIFRKQIGQTVLAKMIPIKEIPDQKKVHSPPSLLKICKIISKYYKVPSKSLFTVKRFQENLPRKVAIYLAAGLSGKKFDLIANFFKKISASGVSQIILRTNKLKISNLAIDNDITNLSELIRK